MAYDGSLIFDTKVDASGLVKDLGKLGSVAKKSIGVVTTAVSAAGTALAGLGGAAINAGITFESAFAGVKKTVDATDAEISALREGILDLAGEMPMTADAIAGIAESAGQLGIQNENILGFTKTMADLGVATNLAGEEAASTLAKFANITDMDQSNFDRLGSTIVALGNSLATTEADIAAMAMRLAGTGKQIGLSEAQILSFAGALSSVGIEAEAGGTAFSKVFKDMQLAVETGNADLANFAKVAGMSTAQFKTAFQTDAAGAILAFIDGLGKSEERGMSVVKVLDDLGITEVRMSDALSRASGATTVFAKALSTGTTAWQENIALTKEAEQRYATMESRIAILRNKVTELGVTFYESTNTDVGGAVDLLSEYVGEIQAAFEGDGLAGAVGALGDIIGDLAVRIAEAAPDILSAGAVLIEKLADSLTENADAVGAAAAEIAVLLVKTIQKFIPKIVDLAGEILKGFAKGLGDALPILKPFTAALELIGDNLKTLTTITVAYIAATKGMEIVSQVSAWLKRASKAATDYARVCALGSTAQMQATAAAKAYQIVAAGLTGKMSLLAAAKALCTKAQLALNAAWAANPVGLVVAGVVALGAAIAGLISLANRETEAERAKREELEALTSAIEENRKATEERKAAYDAFVAEQDSKTAAELAEIETTKQLAAELKTLADESGHVQEKDRARVSFILGEMNSALGKEYQLVDGNIQKYKELQESIVGVIQAKETEKLMENAQAKYDYAMDNIGAEQKRQAAALQDLSKETALYNEKMEERERLSVRVAELEREAAAGNTSVCATLDALRMELGGVDKELLEHAGAMQNAQSVYDVSTAKVQEYTDDIYAYQHASTLAAEGNYEAANNYLRAQTDAMQNAASAQEKYGDDTEAILGALLATYQSKLSEVAEAMRVYSETGSEDALKNLQAALSGLQTASAEYEAAGGKITEGIAKGANGETLNLNPILDKIEEYAAKTPALGQDFADGFIGGLRGSDDKNIASAAAAGAALAAAAAEGVRKEQDSNSPAKVTYALGDDFVAGYENAILSGQGSAFSAGEALAESALEGIKRLMPEGMDFALDSAEWEISKEGKRALAELKLHREIGLITEKEYYEKLEYWRNGYLKKGTQDWWDYTIEIAEGFEKLSEVDKKRLSETAKKEKAALKDRLDLGLISETEYYTGLGKIRDAYFAEGSEEWLSYTKEIAKYQKEAVEAQKKEIVSLFTEAAEEAGKSIEEVLKLQENMEKKLRSFTASPYDAKTVRLRGVGENGEDVEYSVNSLHDYAVDNAALSAYRDAIIAVKERGVPPEFLDVMRDMSVEEGTTLAKLLTEASDEEFDSYLTSWQENRDLTKEIAQDLYRDEATTAAQTLTAALEAAGKEVPEGFFDNGKTAAENFGEGFIEKISTVVTKIKSAFSSQMQGILPKITYSGGVPVYGSSTNNFNSVVNISAVSPAQQNMLAKGTKITQTLGGNT